MASREDHMEMRMGSILYDYDAQEDDELTIRAGERFHLVRSFDDGWWHVQVNQDDGMIPSNFALLDSDGGAATDQEDHLSSRQLSSAKPLSSSHASNKNLMQDIRSPDRVSSKDPFEPMLVDHEDRSSPEKVIVKKLSKKTLKQPLPVPLLQEEDSPRDLSLVIPPELDKTPRETGGAPSSSNTLSNQSPELRRLKDLREQATLKIDALR